MGFASRGVCHATIEAAADAVCSQAYPVNWGDSAGTHSLQCEAVASGGVLTLRRSLDGVPGTSTQSLQLVAPPCDENEARNDMLQLWGILIAGLAVLFIVKVAILRPLFANQ